MSWIKLDDQIAHHPKFTAISPAACWLYVCGIGFCQKFLTDGFIPKSSVSTLSHIRNSSQLASSLVRVGLWDQRELGFVVHDYLDFNEAASEVKRRLEMDRKRKLSSRNPDGIQSDSKEFPAQPSRARASHPIPSHPKKEQIHTLAAPATPRNGNGTDAGKSNIPIIARLVKEALKNGSSDEDLAEDVKTLCARNHIAYDSGMVLLAIHSAQGQQKRKRA